MPIVDVTGNGSKVQCSKEQYCLGTLNVRSMNQGKLEVVKQQMTRVNIDILGIKTKMDQNRRVYGQESLRRQGVATTVNKRV